MSYDQRQESHEDAMPVNLLLFRYGEAILAVHGYTDAEQTIIRDNVVFEPVPVDAGSIAASGTLDRKTLEIRVPTTTDIAQLPRLVFPPSFLKPFQLIGFPLIALLLLEPHWSVHPNFQNL
jgi:hypothetical protein